MTIQHTTTTSGKRIEFDNYSELFYTPHYISVLLLLISGLLYAAFHLTEHSSVFNMKMGIFACCIFFLVWCMIVLPDGPYIRPHPLFWRFVNGLSVLYALLLTLALFQTAEDARHALTYINPNLGKPLPERSYAEQCDIYTPYDNTSNFRNVLDTVYDEFVLSHLLGWWGKSVMLRHPAVSWSLSILFEILELTFEHMLENFKECWWDHVILDILVCNAMGIYLGQLTCRFFEMKAYQWTGLESISSTKGKIIRVLEQATPFSWESYEWHMLESPKRLASIIFIVSMIAAAEVNAFFLKFVLWIPPTHPLNIIRLIFWFLLGLAAVREFYEYTTNPAVKKFGHASWLSCAIIFLEIAVCVKFGKGMFPNPCPPEVIQAWVAGIVVFFIWAIWFFVLRNKSKDKSA